MRPKINKRATPATTTVIFKGIPKNLWCHFRSACTLRGITAKEQFLSLVRGHLEKLLRDK